MGENRPLFEAANIHHKVDNEYQLRVAASPELGIPTEIVSEFVISRGDQRERDLDLAVSLLDQIAEDIANTGRRHHMTS